MARDLAPIVLILGQDSLRADRAMERVFKARDIDPTEIVRIWGDESSFADVFAATFSRTLFSPKTVVVVRRAERLRGGGRSLDEDAEEDVNENAEASSEPPSKRGGRAVAGNPTVSAADPQVDPSATLILMARKADRRLGMWKRVSKVAEVIEADYLKTNALTAAAAAEAKALGLRISSDIVRETVELCGPALGRIVSEFEKMSLYQGATGGSADDILAVTSSAPLYHLSDALTMKNKRKSLELLDQALRQGEAGLRVLATAQGTVRKLGVFRVLRRRGLSSDEAGSQAGVMPFKIRDTERASGLWSDGDIARSLTILAEADRRLKLSAPAAPLLAHAISRMTAGERA